MIRKKVSKISPKITVITDPIPIGHYFFKQNLKSFLRFIKKFFFGSNKKYNKSKYRGHFAVTRSLIEGLESHNLKFTYNPKHKKNIAKNLIVLSNVDALKQAIILKKKGVVKKIFAGPNILVFASDHNYIIANKEIDYIITPCDWVADLYISEAPSLKGRTFSWPAGVDTNFWYPTNKKKSQILVFNKQNKGPVGPIEPYVDYLIKNNHEVKVLNYGEFNHQGFLLELQKSKLLVGFVTDESQGIAWAEAWSCNVPTLLLKNEYHELHGRRYKCSTAPYLCHENGLFFNNLNDFVIKLEYALKNINKFKPREWVINNMSDEYCSLFLYNFVTKNHDD